ncbi:MAG TPA: prolyl oligopeptidase family serine peptidase [Syntrophorhabdaceae bacterium]|nr:prolyl oligopeptidase family serine peptidase [Syntrophorhabdaceae bacterium]
MIEQFEVKSAYNKIKGIITAPHGKGRYPCVILSHGLVSSKESSKYIALSEALVNVGIASCRFDYHGCGESTGRIEDTTLTIRLENLDCITDYMAKKEMIDPDRLAILGSSFGGATGIIKASRDRRIRCISFWATPYMLEKKEGDTISDIKFSNEIFDDFSRYDILAEAERVSHGLCIHGDMDEVVPYQEGIAIFNKIKEPKRLEIIGGADHIFSNPVHRQRAIELALDWFVRFLLGV